MQNLDVIIIGAGAAGLACADSLQKAGIKVLMLEARNRIGGRAFTLGSPHFDQPVEFGAEFIHGAPTNLLKILEEKNLAFNDVLDRHFYTGNGKLKKQEQFWERLQKISDRLNPERKRDRTVREFIRSQGPKIPTDLKKIFVGYVEGFQAANLDLIL
jgi:monoamine oxidase